MNHPVYTRVTGPVGYLLDIYKFLSFRYTNPHSYTKYRQIVAVARRTNARTFVETGTYRGVTTQRCIGEFQAVYTIELDGTLAREAQRRLARFKTCKVIEGDATIVVQRLLDDADIGDRLLVFLDGHFSGCDTAHGEEAEPALAVIKTLVEHRERISAIIVDDFREFGTQSGWPSKGDLLTALEKGFPNLDFEICVHLDQVLVMRRAKSVASLQKKTSQPA